MKRSIEVITLAAILCGGFLVQAADSQVPLETGATTAARAFAIRALRSEQLKYEAGKSTVLNVCQLSKDLRAVELQTSANAAQRTAAHKRHVAVVGNLKDETDKRIEKGFLAPVYGKLVARKLIEAEAELLRAQKQ